jgi:uncharacterized cupin superfamily protein
MVPEALLEPSETGLIQAGPGWFVVNAREARWRYAKGRGAVCPFGDEAEFPQLGVNLFVLAAGEPMGMYHWEADQEDFLVVAGEALLIVEGEERLLRSWDFVHCPAGTKHIIVGAGAGPCVVVAVGAREHQEGAGWGGYTVDEVALRHGAGVEQETTDAQQAYGEVPRRQATRCHEGWLRGLASEV